MEIYLVRHTKVSVKENTCYGNSDVGLADSFIREAEVVKSKIPNLEYLVCYSSPLTRCKLLSEKLNCKEINFEPRLKELNFMSENFGFELGHQRKRQYLTKGVEGVVR